MENYIVRATAAQGEIRAFAAVTTNLVHEITKIHEATPVVAAALGRTLTMAGIMGTMLKGKDDLLTIIIKGDGPMKGLTVTADSKGTVKGFPYEPQVIIPPKSNGKLDVSGAVGKGVLTIIRDLGLREPYVGQLPLVTGEIAEDFAYYYAQSEQVPSIIGLGVLTDPEVIIKQAGGFLIQLMPGVQEKTIEILESRIPEIPHVTKLLEENMSGEDVIKFLLKDFDVTIGEKTELKLECNCTKERFERGLLSIGKKDLQEILEEDEKAEVNCHFCGEKYHFSKEDLEKMIESSSR